MSETAPIDGEVEHTRNWIYYNTDPEGIARRGRIRKFLKKKHGITTAEQITPDIVEKIADKYLEKDDGPRKGRKSRDCGTMILSFFVSFKAAMMTAEEDAQHAQEGPWMIL